MEALPLLIPVLIFQWVSGAASSFSTPNSTSSFTVEPVYTLIRLFFKYLVSLGWPLIF